jgi:hypothetical protein
MLQACTRASAVCSMSMKTRVLTGISLRSGKTAQAGWLGRHQPGSTRRSAARLKLPHSATLAKMSRSLVSNLVFDGSVMESILAIQANQGTSDGVALDRNMFKKSRRTIMAGRALQSAAAHANPNINRT